jgi:hypothetical protein
MIKVVKLKNSFGIKKINFNIGNDTDNNLLIYSPNGTFKTSFAKSLKRISDGEKPEDLIFNDNTEYEIHLESKVFKHNNLEPFEEIVFFSEDFNKGKQIGDSDFSSLVANDEAKQKYLKKVNEYKDNLRDLVEDISLKFFTKSKKDKENATLKLMSEAFNSHSSWEQLISKISLEKFEKFDFPYKYKDIFDDSVFSVVTDDKFTSDIGVYLDTIASKVKSSLFKGQFGPQEAQNVAKTLKENHFFNEGLSINLRDETKVSTLEEFERLISREMDKLFKDPEVKEAYEKINDKLKKNASTRKFSQIIKKDFNIIREMRYPKNFKKRVILSLLSDLSDNITDVYNEIEEINRDLQSIVNQYKHDRLIWDEIIEEFNQRFEFPLEVEIINRENAIIGIEVPEFKFTYVEPNRKVEVQENRLTEFLSTGEKNVFSILNFLLELRVKTNNFTKTIIIVDDIVDSFDYKNKYATVSYLDELSKNESVQVLIMTHNFDFYRTMAHSNYKKYIAYSVAGKITIEAFVDFCGFKILNSWRKSYKDDKSKVLNYYSMVPFARSIEELKNGNSKTFMRLTQALHYKSDFAEGKFRQLFKAMNKSVGFRAWKLWNKPVYSSLFNICDTICANSRGRKAEKKLLQDKLILSIGIRVLFEKKVIEKFSIDKTFLDSIKINQTRVLVDHINSSLSFDELKIANKVLVYTPEFIHINTFMVEPIIDLSIVNLVALYNEVKEIV